MHTYLRTYHRLYSSMWASAFLRNLLDSVLFTVSVFQSLCLNFSISCSPLSSNLRFGLLLQYVFSGLLTVSVFVLFPHPSSHIQPIPIHDFHKFGYIWFVMQWIEIRIVFTFIVPCPLVVRRYSWEFYIHIGTRYCMGHLANKWLYILYWNGVLWRCWNYH